MKSFAAVCLVTITRLSAVELNETYINIPTFSIAHTDWSSGDTIEELRSITKEVGFFYLEMDDEEDNVIHDIKLSHRRALEHEYCNKNYFSPNFTNPCCINYNYDNNWQSKWNF